jgi:hypothetical protein
MEMDGDRDAAFSNREKPTLIGFAANEQHRSRWYEHMVSVYPQRHRIWNTTLSLALLLLVHTASTDMSTGS